MCMTCIIYRHKIIAGLAIILCIKSRVSVDQNGHAIEFHHRHPKNKFQAKFVKRDSAVSVSIEESPPTLTESSEPTAPPSYAAAEWRKL